jgi:acyl-ACP thioesterase
MITVQTWPRGVEGLLAMREFLVLDRTGARLGGASSQWFVVDTETRKPVPPVFSPEVISLINPSRALDELPEKIIVPEPLSFSYAARARYNDLDMYRHVNNTRYIEWILNAFPEETFRWFFVHSFLIEFLAEVHTGEEIQLFWNKGMNPSVFKGVRMEDDKTIFRARINWRSR